MGALTSAGLKGLAILSMSLLFIFIVPALAPILVPVVTVVVFSIVPFSIFTTLVLVLTTALAMFSNLPGYVFTAPVPLLLASHFLHLLYSKSKLLVADNHYAPVSVNYFPSRECNYSCGFCFHTNTSGYILPLDEAKRGLRLLKGKNQSSPFAAPRLHILECSKMQHCRTRSR